MVPERKNQIKNDVKKLFLAVCIVLSANGYSQNPNPVKSGKELYESKCARCHGKDGTKGNFGAINLQYSYIGDTEMFNTISNGRRFMPTWKKRLSADEIRTVMNYIKTLRK